MRDTISDRYNHQRWALNCGNGVLILTTMVHKILCRVAGRSFPSRLPQFRPCWPRPSGTPPTRPVSRSQTVCPSTGTCPLGSFREHRLTQRTTQMVLPLRSPAITEGSPLLRAGPPASPASVLTASRFPPPVRSLWPPAPLPVAVSGPDGRAGAGGARGRGDQPMPAQPPRQDTDQGGDDSPVRPVQSRSRVGTPRDRDLVAQHQQLDIFPAAAPRACRRGCGQ
jgi:hypothetical protein